MTIQPPQIQLHLAGIGRLEIAELQLDDYQPPQPAMVEEQVDVVVVAVERDALLPFDEGEAGPSSRRNALDLAEQRRLSRSFSL